MPAWALPVVEKQVLCDCAFEAKFAACGLRALDEFAGAREQHAPSVLDEGNPGGCREMALASAGGPNRSTLAPFSSQLSVAASAVTCAFTDHRDGLEVEGREYLADRQTGFGKMVLDAAAALRHIVLGQCSEELRRGPAFLELRQLAGTSAA